MTCYRYYRMGETGGSPAGELTSDDLVDALERLREIATVEPMSPRVELWADKELLGYICRDDGRLILIPKDQPTTAEDKLPPYDDGVAAVA